MLHLILLNRRCGRPSAELPVVLSNGRLLLLRQLLNSKRTAKKRISEEAATAVAVTAAVATTMTTAITTTTISISLMIGAEEATATVATAGVECGDQRA